MKNVSTHHPAALTIRHPVVATTKRHVGFVGSGFAYANVPPGLRWNILIKTKAGQEKWDTISQDGDIFIAALYHLVLVAGWLAFCLLLGVDRFSGED